MLGETLVESCSCFAEQHVRYPPALPARGRELDDLGFFADEVPRLIRCNHEITNNLQDAVPWRKHVEHLLECDGVVVGEASFNIAAEFLHADLREIAEPAQIVQPQFMFLHFNRLVRSY